MVTLVGVFLMGANKQCTPEVTFVSPAEDSRVRGSVVVQIQATPHEELTIQEVILSVDGTEVSTLLGKEGLWETVLDTTLLSEGQHTWKAEARDSADQVGLGKVSVTVDNFPDPPPPQGGAFGGTIEGLGIIELGTFVVGALQFRNEFDGVGPTFNDRTCANCHSDPQQGGSSGIVETHFSAFMDDGTCDPLMEEGGFALQDEAVMGVGPEVVPKTATGVGIRSSSPVHGLGLVDAIAEETILAGENPDNVDGISGRANFAPDGRVGRFGRKAFVPSLLDFTFNALLFEQGLTTSAFPQENTINGVPVSDDTPDPEISDSTAIRLTRYMSFFQPPPRAEITGIALRGWELFVRDTMDGGANCAGCHTPSMQTADNPELNDVHRNKTVWLFSDLLLHDMVGDPNNPSDGSDICLGNATPDEFRTELLMGLSGRGQFMHDGSAPDLRSAIEAHDGEAAASRKAFIEFTPEDQEALLEFLSRI